MVKSLAIFEKPTPGHHMVRPGRVGQLAAPRAGIPLARRCRRALRGTHTHTHTHVQPTHTDAHASIEGRDPEPRAESALRDVDHRTHSSELRSAGKPAERRFGELGNEASGSLEPTLCVALPKRFAHPGATRIGKR
eukprot:2407396-Pyramimonas_sp.AAC.1